MPRNSLGTYTLPAGNPVVTGTTISSVWGNTTMSDIGTALTDSLSRSGQGGMTASLPLADGLIGAPGLTWGNEPTSGLYRAGAGDFGYSIASTRVLQIVAAATRFVDGTAALPAMSFISDPDTGVFRLGANQLAFSVAGGRVAYFESTGQFYITADGTAPLPAYSFNSDPDTGVYRIGANNLGFSAGGAKQLDISTSIVAISSALTVGSTANVTTSVTTPQVVVSKTVSSIPDSPVFITAATPYLSWDDSDAAANNRYWSMRVLSEQFQGVVFNDASGAATTWVTVDRTGTTIDSVDFPSSIVRHIDGVVGAPAVTFVADPDTGIYRSTSNTLAISAGGSIGFAVDTTSVYTRDGAVGSPGYSFLNDSDTGLYRIGANQMGFSAGGVFKAELHSSGFFARFQDGAVGTPSLTFDADPTTGFYRITTSEIGISLGGALLGSFKTGTFTGTLTGMTAGTTGTVAYRKNGSRVSLFISANILGTSNTTAMTMTGLPADVQPTFTQEVLCTSISDNTVSNQNCRCSISGGTIAFALMTASGAVITSSTTGFTAAGQKGLFSSWSITYDIK